MKSLPLNAINPLYASYYILYEDGRILNTNSGKYLKMDCQNRYSLDYIGKDRPVHRSIRALYKQAFNKSYHGEDKIENLPDEQWKEIQGTNESYYISNYGRVKSYAKHVNPRILKPFITRCSPYLSIDISIDGQDKTFLVHRLVAMYFLPDTYSDDKEVHHKDHNTLNNHVSNLECLTKQEHYDKHRQVQDNAKL